MKLLLFTPFLLLVMCAGIETSYKVGVTSSNGIIYGAEYTPRDWNDSESKSKLDITAQK
jgi:hypothetical protein